MGIGGVLTSLRALLAMPDRLRRDLRPIERELRTISEATRQPAKRVDGETELLRADIATLQAEVHDRLLQYHLQLGRLTALVDGGDRALPLSRRVPVAVTPGRTRPASASTSMACPRGCSDGRSRRPRKGAP